MIIILTNLITIVLLLSTIIVLAFKIRAHGQNSLSQHQLLFSFFLLIMGTVADTLYHLDYGKLFDTYGEYINLLFFPLIIFSIFTNSINKELENKKRNEILLQNQNEEYLRINRKLSESNLALSKTNMELDSFVYRVSHDLRAPICTSMGLSDLSLMSTDILEIKHYLSLQKSSFKRLDKYIKDILDYSKNSNLELVPQLIDFNLIVDNAFQDYQNYDPTNIKLIKKFDLVIPFHNDLLRIKIIFNNLISNAIKFQKASESNPFIEISIFTSPENVTISIRDNGIGIKEEYIKDVFKMFFRGTCVGNGSGIGLYIVEDCILKINGQLKLDSKLNRGTTIEISIPNVQPD